MPAAEKTLCRTPTPDKQPVRIEAGKFALVREAILAVLPTHGEGVPFQQMPKLVERHLPPAGARSARSRGM